MNRRTRLIRRFRDKDYRETYVGAFLNSYIAAQIRALREARGLSQGGLAQLIGTKQSGVSKLENVNYSSWSIRTLKNLAKALDVALVVRFVSFGEALSDIERFNAQALIKPKFAEDPVFLSVESPVTSVSTSMTAQAQAAYSSQHVLSVTSRATIPKLYAKQTSPGLIHSATVT